jgi:hypothetical protein
MATVEDGHVQDVARVAFEYSLTNTIRNEPNTQGPVARPRDNPGVIYDSDRSNYICMALEHTLT